MIKKVVEYETFDGEKRKEEFYFHLFVREVTKLEMSFKEGLLEHMKKLAEAEDKKNLFNIIDGLICDSYGVKIGDRFTKSPELKEAFFESRAFDALYIELVGDQDKLFEFINGIMPSELEQLAAKNATKPDLTVIQ